MNNQKPNKHQSRTSFSTRRFCQIFARSTTTIFTHSASFWTFTKQSTICSLGKANHA